MTEEEVKALIAAKLRVPLSSVTPDADLVEDLGADSLALAEMTAAVEEQTGARIPLEQLQEIMTVGDIVRAADSQI